MKKVAPSERFRRELDDVLASVDSETDPVERIGRLGARLILQQALEEEVTEFLGRARYERAIDPVSHRNGYEPRGGDDLGAGRARAAEGAQRAQLGSRAGSWAGTWRARTRWSH